MDYKKITSAIKLFETIQKWASYLERSRDSFRIDITNQLDYQDVSERP